MIPALRLLCGACLGLILTATVQAVVVPSLDPDDPWPMFMQNDRNTGKSPYKALTVPLLRWEDELTASGVFAPVIIRNSTQKRMIVVPAGNELRAYDVAGGNGLQPKLLWRYPAASGSTFSGKISVADIYTGVGDITKKVLYAATTGGGSPGGTVYAIPIEVPQNAIAPEDTSMTRTDPSLWAELEIPSTGSYGGFTPLSFMTTNEQVTTYKSVVVGPHLDGKVVARNAFTGCVEWESDSSVDFGAGSLSQPAVGLTGEGARNIYVTAVTSDNYGLMAFRVDEEGTFDEDLAWKADVGSIPTMTQNGELLTPGGLVMTGGTYSSATVADDPSPGITDRFVYVPSDNGVFYTFDRTASPTLDGNNVPIMDAYDKFVEITTVSQNPQTVPHVYDGTPFSTTTAVFHLPGQSSSDGSNLLFTAREGFSGGFQSRLIQSGDCTMQDCAIQLEENYGKGRLFSGVAVDSVGTTFFSGQSHDIDGNLLFDLKNAVSGDLGTGIVREFSQMAYGDGLVIPIDSDGTIYAMGQKIIGVDEQDNPIYSENSYLFAFQHGILGDMNIDGVVDNLDIQLFIDALADPNNYNGVADMNQDGIVNNGDIQLFINELPGGFMSIPEPGTASLATLMCVLLGLRRNRVA